MPNRHDVQDKNGPPPPQEDSVWTVVRNIINKFSEEAAIIALVMLTYLYGLQAGVNHVALHLFCFAILGGYLTLRLVQMLKKKDG